MPAAIPPETLEEFSRMTADLLARRDKVLGTGAPLFYTTPLHLVRGEGVYLYGPDGRRYVDMYNNVPCIGHANPDVVEAMARQQGTLNVHSRYLHEGILDFTERLAGLHGSNAEGSNIESVIVSCSGTEAVEVALRMAKFATGQQGIVCTNATYHGNSEAVSKLTRLALGQNSSPDVRSFPFPETYRPIADGASEAELCEAYLARLEEAIRSLQGSPEGFAGLILCSILANEGLPDIPAGFMARAADMARAAGGLVIADEVQAGYCRTGTWWGYTTTGYTPDIVVTGKPMGNGLPLAATAASKVLVDGFRARTRYFNTFASSPLQAAVGLAVIEYIEREDLAANVAAVGASLKAALAARKPRHGFLGDVRGTGLFLGVEIIRDNEAKTPDVERTVAIVDALKDRGFLTSNAGIFRNVLKFRPPLVFRQKHADAFLEAFDEVLAAQV
jgi:4-aminobutyrate aminotransferase-like enzyme